MDGDMRPALLAAWLSVVAVSGAGAASAVECAGAGFPEQIVVDGTPLTLNGLGLRLATMLEVEVYVAALYVASPSGDAKALLESNGARRIVLHFVRDVDAGDLEEAWQEGFERNAKPQLPALQQRIDRLKTWMADMKTGQRLTFTSRPGPGTEVDVNGRVEGAIQGDDFSRALLSLWLGERPPNPGLKAGLLGGRCE
jgi:hypothetical protein